MRYNVATSARPSRAFTFLLRPMVWFFEKDGVYLRVESRVRAEAPRYELVWSGQDGREHVESFETEPALLQRYEAITKDLQQAGWTGPSTWRI